MDAATDLESNGNAERRRVLVEQVPVAREIPRGSIEPESPERHPNSDRCSERVRLVVAGEKISAAERILTRLRARLPILRIDPVATRRGTNVCVRRHVRSEGDSVSATELEPDGEGKMRV